MENSQPDSNMFSVRIVSIDYYMAPPITDLDTCYSSFQGGKVNEVPVIRIYGSTPAGQKTCLHVHRVLPYLYVPCSDLIHTPEEGDTYTLNISNAIEKALKSKLKSSSGFKRQHVHGCSLVRARKFYGFHSSEELFVKIYLYYPHEVARVATLLLDGAVLERSYQPHESHIPYLLQFLIDHNLYGMGHLHVSKVKFRHPLPDGFNPRAAHQNGVSKHTSVKLACGSANDQADSSTRSCLGSPVWISTTVPNDWKWPPLIATDCSPDQDACLTKRQSTCELEGDSTVDEIVNQQSKLYSSLSQTRSDVKMVQSLLPIWQEEYERTGMQEEVIHSELSKPLPENVLKTLSHGRQCEIAFMNLFEEVQKSSSSQLTPAEDAERFLQSIGSLADVGNLCETGEANLNCSSGSASSDVSLSKQDVDAVPSELRYISSEIVPDNEEMGSLKKTDHSYPKGIDTEALGLLRWLASSQAEGDLNTDDELGYDLVLSPLFPKAGIDKILEKANLDYECESQQECQDILDSVGDTNSYNLKERVVQSTSDNLSTQIPSENIIPQVDGLFDDLVTDCGGNVSEIDLNNEMGRPSLQESPGIDKGPAKKKKKRNRLWGSLPFSALQKADEDPESRFKSTDVSNEMTNCMVSSSSGKKDSEGCDDSVSDTNTNIFGEMDPEEPTGSSMRDLMRRKRLRKLEPSEAATCSVKKVHLDEQHETPISSRQLEFHVKKNDIKNVLPSKISGEPWVTDLAATPYERHSTMPEHAHEGCPKDHRIGPSCGDIPMYGKLPLMPCTDRSLQGSTSKNPHSNSHTQPDHQAFGVSSIPQSNALIDVSLFPAGIEELPKPLISSKQEAAVGIGLSECCIVDKAELFSRRLMKLDETGQEGHTTESCRSENTYGNNDTSTAADVQESENFSIQQVMQTCSSCPSLCTMHSSYIEMSFSKKAPAVDWRNWKPVNTSLAPVVPDQSFVMNEENSEGTLRCSTGSLDYEGSDADELPPFFSDNGVDKEKTYKSHGNNNGISSSQEVVLGIPTHYKNDGSLSYLLTTMHSPPSVYCVNEWLLHHPRRQDAAGASVGSVLAKLLDPPSPSSNGLEFSRQNTVTDEKTASGHIVLTCGNDSMDSQEILVDVYHETLPESRSVPQVESRDEFTQKSNKDPNRENTYLDFTSKLHSEGTILKANEHVANLRNVSQISAPDAGLKLTPLSQTGFRDPASIGDGQQLTLMSIEVHAESRGDLRSDPRFDAINVIAVTIQEDNVPSLETIVLLHDNAAQLNQRNLDGISGCRIIVTSEEKHLFYHFMKIVRISDPDILMGWEIQGGSLGFLAERAAHLGVILLDNLSRTPSCETKLPDPYSATQEIGLPDDLLAEALITDPTVSEDKIINDEWGRTHASGVHVGGRIVLNVWRLMRGEIKLNMYTVEAVAEEVLRRRVPLIPPRILSQWFLSGPGQARYRCLEYIIERANLNLEIMNQLDMINRTSELARVFGIDFFSVLSRGSQYRVESMFLRLAHTQNYLAISPGNQQVASQPAMECLPLVMEPESHFYADPVVVLDFQSLYPSMIIAYNLCFCTCLGKVLPAKENTLGVSSYFPDPQLLMDLKNKILLTPNGVMYVPSEVRKGVLPRLLEEILSTRIMVKRAMKKLTPSQRVLHRIFNARQLALKLISNVTYGYTAAGFSGRMPCAELADSIVQCGRRTLESAISFVNSHERWNARVIYGDTDSMFVLLKGRSVEESFSIGQEIASVITSMNPDPVTLKMEKVYHPCFLLTKKRYVGFSYEVPDQTEPLFDAKGIETVRRDSCEAVAKTLEQSLRLFFKHQDIAKVKMYLQRQWTRILGGRVSLQDFVFAKEVRLGTYSARSSSLPPSAIVATKAMKADPRAEPRYAERIPYVVIHGEPGARLVDMVVDPLELLAMESPFRLNDSYYINKQIIPALQRVFGLVGADLRQWFLEMPRPVRPSVGKRFSYAPIGQRTRIDSYYISRHCFLCGELVQASNQLCDKCSKKEPAVATAASGRTSKLERDIQHLAAICRHCGGGDWIVENGVKCVSLACSVFYERRKVQKELQALSAVATEMGFYPKCTVEWF